MSNLCNQKALLAIDFINEIVHVKGKLSGKGYSQFIEKHSTLEKVKQLFSIVRNQNIPLIHVRVGFSSRYQEHPQQSPLFGTAAQFNALQLETWATEFHQQASPISGEIVLTKHRVSAFYGTPLDLILRNKGVQNLLICGVATDLAVQSAVRDAHDRDYMVTVISDCCGAANEDDHEQSLRTMLKMCAVVSLKKLNLTGYE
jgi:nicotinamidase-related amidase